MGFKILDGKGSGKYAEVSQDNKLYVDSVTHSSLEQASINGDSYNVNTGVVNLTSANESGVLYFESQEDNDVEIHAWFYMLGASTGGSGDILLKAHRNPTGGTVTTSGTSISALNRNFKSSNTLSANIYKGAEGLTVTGGDDSFLQTLATGSGRIMIGETAVILGKGSAIGFTMVPPSGNTSMDVMFAMAVHFRV